MDRQLAKWFKHVFEPRVVVTSSCVSLSVTPHCGFHNCLYINTAVEPFLFNSAEPTQLNRLMKPK